MGAARFFVTMACAPGVDVELVPDDAHHAATVLRVKKGDRIVVSDAAGAWDAEVTNIGKRIVNARVREASAEVGGELPVDVTVLQALAKGAKFDTVVEKSVELGARRIIPIRCARSYAEATPFRLDRWRRIARAAAQQSRRRIVPDVDDPIEWGAAMLRCASVPLVVAHERAEAGSLRTACAAIGAVEGVAIAVGPEGGFTDDEVDAARAAGAHIVSLGPTTLRTETAAAAMLAGIAALRGWW